MRKNEGDRVAATFRENFGANLVYVNARERFLSGLPAWMIPSASD